MGLLMAMRQGYQNDSFCGRNWPLSVIVATMRSMAISSGIVAILERDQLTPGNQSRTPPLKPTSETITLSMPETFLESQTMKILFA